MHIHYDERFLWNRKSQLCATGSSHFDIRPCMTFFSKNHLHKFKNCLSRDKIVILYLISAENYNTTLQTTLSSYSKMRSHYDEHFLWKKRRSEPLTTDALHFNIRARRTTLVTNVKLHTFQLISKLFTSIISGCKTTSAFQISGPKTPNKTDVSNMTVPVILTLPAKYLSEWVKSTLKTNSRSFDHKISYIFGTRSIIAVLTLSCTYFTIHLILYFQLRYLTPGTSCCRLSEYSFACT